MRLRHCPSVVKGAITGFRKANFGLYDLSRKLIKLADDKAFEESVKREKEMFAEAARTIKGNPAFLVDLRKVVKPAARAAAIITAQTSRVLEYSVRPSEENISPQLALWTKDADVNSLATAACQGALNAQMLHEGITRDSISHLLREPPRELDAEPDAVAPAAAADDGPGGTPDGASGDHAPGASSPSCDALDELEPLARALPRASGAPDDDDGASALPAAGCVRARARARATLRPARLSPSEHVCARHTPPPLLALTRTPLLCAPLADASRPLRRPRKYSSKQPTQADIVGCQFYRVRHTGGTSASSSNLCEVCSEDLRAEDFGMSGALEDTTIEHFACALWCTCQFLSHWGLPCRHMVAVWHHESRLEIPDGVVHRRWLLEDEDEVQRRLYAHRARALPRRAPRAAADAAMTAVERAAELAAMGKLIAEAASSTPALHAAAKTRLEDMLSALRSGTLTAGDTRGARAQAAASRAQGASAAASNQTPLPAVLNPAGKKTAEPGGHRKKGVQERAQDAARGKAAKATSATAKRANSASHTGTADKRAKK